MRYLVEHRLEAAVVEADGLETAAEVWFLNREQEKGLTNDGFRVLVTPLPDDPVEIEVRRKMSVVQIPKGKKPDPDDIPF